MFLLFLKNLFLKNQLGKELQLNLSQQADTYLNARREIAESLFFTHW